MRLLWTSGVFSAIVNSLFVSVHFIHITMCYEFENLKFIICIKTYCYQTFGKEGELFQLRIMS